MKFEQIRVRAASKLAAELKHGQYIDCENSAAIICTDDPVKDPIFRNLKCSRLQFEDTENPGDDRAFTRSQARAASNFLNNLPENISTLYCCCDWGQSRSAGMAAACMMASGMDYTVLFDNKSYSPNLLVFSYMCEALGCGLPSKEMLQDLRLRRESAKNPLSEKGQKERKLSKIILAGDFWRSSMNQSSAEGDKDFDVWNELPIRVVNKCGSWETIPQSEEEFLNDRKTLGTISVSDELVVISGGFSELISGIPATEITRRMRKYLIWVKYVNPGVRLLLISPEFYSSTGAESQSAGELAKHYRSLADEMSIEFLANGKRYPTNTQSLEESSSDFTDAFSGYLMKEMKHQA